jgi:tripartite-type tricarboxylate transporter receptor subunit TctC
MRVHRQICGCPPTRDARDDFIRDHDDAQNLFHACVPRLGLSEQRRQDVDARVTRGLAIAFVELEPVGGHSICDGCPAPVGARSATAKYSRFALCGLGEHQLVKGDDFFLRASGDDSREIVCEHQGGSLEYRIRDSALARLRCPRHERADPGAAQFSCIGVHVCYPIEGLLAAADIRYSSSCYSAIGRSQTFWNMTVRRQDFLFAENHGTHRVARRMCSPVRTAIISLWVFSILSAISQHAAAQKYPDKPVRLVIPYAPGGTSDILARLIAAPLWQVMGQPVIADNRPGAGSNIGAEIVANANPDGYTLLIATPAFASNPALYGKVNYDPVRSFEPITLVAEVPIVLVVHPGLPAKSVTELIALAKAQPGKLNFGSSGHGGIGHLVGELFKSSTGVNMVHVPYKGNGPALVDLMAGVLNLTFSDLAGASPYIKGGRMRSLAITSARRSPSMPDLPTMNEAGVPGFQATSWFAMFATGKTPKPIVNELNANIVKVINMPDVRDRLNGLGFEVVGSSPAELAAYMKVEIAKWSKVVKESGAKVD